MTDREVGELSKLLRHAGDDSAFHWQWQCEKLICKLVEERAKSNFKDEWISVLEDAIHTPEIHKHGECANNKGSLTNWDSYKNLQIHEASIEFGIV